MIQIAQGWKNPTLEQKYDVSDYISMQEELKNNLYG